MPDKSVHIPQSAILPYRIRKSALEILLITSIGSGRWVLPRGHIEPELTARQSAIKEAFEEAGINGKVPRTSFGTYTYRKDDRPDSLPYHVEVFTMRVTYMMDSWPEELRRTREWMSASKASNSVDEKELRSMILAFAEEIER